MPDDVAADAVTFLGRQLGSTLFQFLRCSVVSKKTRLKLFAYFCPHLVRVGPRESDLQAALQGLIFHCLGVCVGDFSMSLLSDSKHLKHFNGPVLLSKAIGDGKWYLRAAALCCCGSPGNACYSPGAPGVVRSPVSFALSRSKQYYHLLLCILQVVFDVCGGFGLIAFCDTYASSLKFHSWTGLGVTAQDM